MNVTARGLGLTAAVLLFTSAQAVADQTPAATELPRETAVETALSGAKPISSTAVGGYGELTLTTPSSPATGLCTTTATSPNCPALIDLRRVVFYFGHDFTDQIRFYSELEIEHAVSSDGFRGDVEIEQAYLDWLPSKRFNLRGGLLLMPVGIVNIYHEPPSFFAVDRPDVDTYIIPTTWREPGLGLFGELAEGLRYQLYVVDGLNANNFSAQYGVREGTQEASLAYAGDIAAVARLDYEPILGTVFGASAYGGTSGNTLSSQIGHVPVWMFDLDARSHFRGWTARAEAALLLINDASMLDEPGILGSNGPVARVAWGGYAELGYDLLHWWAPAASQSLILFDRFDGVDMQADMPAGTAANPLYRRYSDIAGLTYKPIPQIALKADYRRQQLATGTGYDELDAAITWLF